MNNIDIEDLEMDKIIVHKLLSPFRIEIVTLDYNDRVLNRFKELGIKYKVKRRYMNSNGISINIIRINKKYLDDIVKIINEFYKYISVFEDINTLAHIINSYNMYVDFGEEMIDMNDHYSFI